MSRKNLIQHYISLELQTKYDPFFKVDILHDYFEDGMFPNIELIPDKMTNIRLKQYKLKASCEGPQLVVGFGANAGTAPPISSISSPIRLSFWIKITDKDFLNYTNLPYEMGDYIYHFTNRDTDKIEDEYGNLSNDEYVQEMDRLPITSSIFDFYFEEPMEDVEVQVVDELGNVIFEEHLEQESNACTIILEGEAPGKYTILLDGLEEHTFYLAGDGIRNMFGVIDIHLDKEDDGPYALFDSEGMPVSNKEYNVRFQTRAVTWKYLFFETNPSNPQHEGHEVYNSSKSGTDVSFLEAETIELDDGSQVVMIQTEEPVPFKEKQEERYKLRTQRGKSKIEWITDLPVPSIKSMLKANINDKNDVFSEIIVYL